MLKAAPIAPLLVALSLAFAACSPSTTIYVALDQQFSEPVLKEFAKELQIDLKQRHDARATRPLAW